MKKDDNTLPLPSARGKKAETRTKRRSKKNKPAATGVHGALVGSSESPPMIDRLKTPVLRGVEVGERLVLFQRKKQKTAPLTASAHRGALRQGDVGKHKTVGLIYSQSMLPAF